MEVFANTTTESGANVANFIELCESTVIFFVKIHFFSVFICTFATEVVLLCTQTKN